VFKLNNYTAQRLYQTIGVALNFFRNGQRTRGIAALEKGLKIVKPTSKNGGQS
jgi:hypothetical protein